MKRSIVLALAAALMAGACTPVPDGQKNGTLTRLAQKGSVHPTWEAELVRGGSFTGGTGVQAGAFEFTISDPELLKKVRYAFENELQVRIKYHQSWPAWWSSDSEGNFLDSIEVVSVEQGGTLERGQQGAAPAAAAGNDPRFNQIMEQNQAILKQNQQLLEVLIKR